MKLAGTIFAAAAAALVAGPLPALANTCSNATIAGAYSARGEGTEGTKAPFLPVSFVSTRYFDGDGKFTGSGYSSIGGVSVAFTTSGTYEVKPDCEVKFVGAISTAAQNLQFGIVTDHGNVIYATRLDKGNTTSIEYDRIEPR